MCLFVRVGLHLQELYLQIKASLLHQLAYESVSLCLYSHVTIVPPPFTRGKRSVDGATIPSNQSSILGHPQNPGLELFRRPILVPTLEPPMSWTLGRPWWTFWEITPTTICQQDVQQRIDNSTWGCSRPATVRFWGRGKRFENSFHSKWLRPSNRLAMIRFLQR